MAMTSNGIVKGLNIFENEFIGMIEVLNFKSM